MLCHARVYSIMKVISSPTISMIFKNLEGLVLVDVQPIIGLIVREHVFYPVTFDLMCNHFSIIFNLKIVKICG